MGRPCEHLNVRNGSTDRHPGLPHRSAAHPIAPAPSRGDVDTQRVAHDDPLGSDEGRGLPLIRRRLRVAMTARRGSAQCRNVSNSPTPSNRWSSSSRRRRREAILDRTLEKLRAGVPTQTMLTASALAVTRSSDLPPGHHGGPLHPLAGLYAVSKLVARLEGEERFVPVLQHVALSNKHIHDPVTGPFSLLEFEPLDCRRRRGDQGGVPQGGQPRRDQQGGPSVPVALGKHSADRSVRPADERGHPEERAGRSLLHLSRLHLAARWRCSDRSICRC